MADSLAEEDFGGAFDATKHLLAHSHTRIAFVGDSNRIPTTARRLEGYRAALAEAGIATGPEPVHLDDSADPAEVGDVIPSLDGVEPPTAIFSSNARTSIATLSQLHALSRTDIAFISFGDFPMSSALVPAVTVIDQDPAALGALAAKQLFARVDNPGRRTRRRPVLPVSLVRRASCVGGAPVDRSGTPVCTLEP